MGLTKKQEIFCKEYVKLDNKTQAYRNAYNTSKMKGSTVNRKAVELFENGKITARVKELQKITADIAEKEFKTDSRELLKHLTILRNSRIDHYVDYGEHEEEGIDPVTGKTQMIVVKSLQFKPFNEITKEQLMCIESIKYTRYGIELKLYSKDWIFEKIAKHIGFYGKHQKQKGIPVRQIVDISNYKNKQHKN